MRDMRFADVARRGLEPDLAVGRLPPTLAVAVRLLLQLDRRCGNGFMHVPAAEAGTVLTVPVSLRDHGAVASAAGPRHGNLSHQASLLIRFQIPCQAFRLPPGLADGFGLKGTALLAGARFTPMVVGPPFRMDSAVPHSRGSWVPLIVITVTEYHLSHRCQGGGRNLYVTA